jgi:hypothetical protein
MHESGLIVSGKYSPEKFAREIGPSLGWKKPNAEYVRQMCRRYLEPEKHKQGADMPKGWTCEKSGRSIWLWRPSDDIPIHKQTGFDWVSLRFSSDDADQADAQRAFVANAFAYSKELPPSLIRELCAIQKDVAESGGFRRVILEFRSNEGLSPDERREPIVYKLIEANQGLSPGLTLGKAETGGAYISIVPPIGREENAVQIAFLLWWQLHTDFSKEDRMLGTENFELGLIEGLLKNRLELLGIGADAIPYVVRQLRVRCINCGKEKRPPRADRKYCDSSCTRAFSKWTKQLKSKSEKTRKALMDVRLEEIKPNLLL